MPEVAASEPFALRVADVFDITGRGTAVVGPIESGVVRTGDRVDVSRNGEIVATATVFVELINDRRADPRSIALLLREMEGLRPETGDEVGSASAAAQAVPSGE